MPQFSQKLGLSLTLLLLIVTVRTVSQTQAACHPVSHNFRDEPGTHAIHGQDIGRGAITAPVSGATHVKGIAIDSIMPKLYWITRTDIKRANRNSTNRHVTLDSFNPEDVAVAAGLSLTQAITLHHPPPEMDVQGNSVSISNGDAVPSTADHTDFGRLHVDSGNLTHTFTIANTGIGDLAVSNITLSGANAGDFVISGITLPVTVSSGSYTTFQVTFDPAAVGLRQAALSLENTDDDEHPYTFAIQGRGLPALVITEIMFDPQSSEPAWEWLELYNAGSSDLNLAGYILDDDDHSPLTSANIAAGSLPSGGTAILYNADSVAAADFSAAWGAGLNLVAVTNWPSLANAFNERLGLWASLTDYENRNFEYAVDQLTYSGDGTGSWPGRNNTGSIYLTNLAANNQDGSNWALSRAGTATPLGNGYTSALAGGNSGGDIGSPGGNFPPTVTTITYTIESDAAAIYEGNHGSQQLTFTISRRGATHLASQVDLAVNGTATFGSDYDNLGGSSGVGVISGTVYFAADETAKTITLDVLGDEIDEDNEIIKVTLTNGTAPEITAYAGNPATTTIIDDDTAGFMIVPVGLIVSEPDTTSVFTISLQSKPTAPVWVNLTSNDSGECIVSSSPQIMLDAYNWQTGVQVTVRAVDDDEIDGPQTCLIYGVSGSADNKYQGSAIDPIAVTINDNELQPIYLPIIVNGFISKPDLVISSISATPLQGGGYEVRVRAANQAGVPVAPSNNFHVVIYRNDNFDTPVIVWGVQGEWFGANQSRTLTANYDGPAGTLTAWADPWNVVIESNESNNRLAGPTITMATGHTETLSSQPQQSGPLPTPTPEQ